MTNLLKNSLSRTLHAVGSHKTLFITLIFLQLIVLVLLLSHAFQAQLVIGKDVQQLGIQVQQANYNPEEIKQGKPFVQDPLLMFQLYRSIKKNLLLFAIQFSSIFLVGQGLLWLVTPHFFAKQGEGEKLEMGKRWKETGKKALKYLASVLFFYGLFFIVLFLVLKSQVLKIDPAVLAATLKYFGYAFLGVFYFLTIALAVINNDSWRIFLQRWFQLAVKKYYLCLPLFLLSLLPAVAAFFGIFYAVQIKSSFPLMLLFTVGLIVFLVLGRIFFVAALRELVQENGGS